MRLTLGLCSLLLLSVTSAFEAAVSVRSDGLHVYVDAVNGKDPGSSGTTTADLPLRTPLRTLSAAHRVRTSPVFASLNATIHISGVHHITAPMDIADFTTYVSDTGDATVSGGVTVPAAAFSPAPSRPGVFVAAVPDSVPTEVLGSVQPNEAVHGCVHNMSEVFFPSSGTAGVLARWPNIAPNGTTIWSAVANATAVGGSTIDLTLSTTHTAAWASESAPFVHIYPQWLWADTYSPVVNASGSVLSIAQTPYMSAVKSSTAQFMGVNLLCELDVAGEYYVDVGARKLYVMPPSGSAEDVVMSVAPGLVNTTGSKGVTLKGMSYLYSTGTGVSMQSSSAVTVVNSRVAFHGTHGLSLNGFDGRVENVTVENVGCRGLSVTGGVQASLQPGNMVVTRSTARYSALWKRTYMPPLFWGGVGNSYTDNHVSNSPHNCILGGGNEVDSDGNPYGGSNVLFSGNVLADCVQECSDCGAFYTCGQDGQGWINRGNKFVNNTVLRSVNAVGHATDAHALYLDDQLSGWTMANNTIVSASAYGLLVGGGRRNHIVHNSFSHCGTGAVYFDNRGMNWEKSSCTAPQGILWKGLESVNYTNPPWSIAYPELETIASLRPCVPVLNVISENTYCDTPTFCTASASTVTSWNSTMSGNVETSSC